MAFVHRIAIYRIGCPTNLKLQHFVRGTVTAARTIDLVLNTSKALAKPNIAKRFQ